MDTSAMDTTVLALASRLPGDISRLPLILIPSLEERPGRAGLLNSLATLCGLLDGCEPVALVLSSVGHPAPVKLYVASATPVPSEAQNLLAKLFRLLSRISPERPEIGTSSTIERADTQALTEEERALVVFVYRSSLRRYRDFLKEHSLEALSLDSILSSVQQHIDESKTLGNDPVTVERLQKLVALLKPVVSMINKPTLDDNDLVLLHHSVQSLHTFFEGDDGQELLGNHRSLRRVAQCCKKISVLFVITSNFISAVHSRKTRSMLRYSSELTLEIIGPTALRHFVADASHENLKRTLFLGPALKKEIAEAISGRFPSESMLLTLNGSQYSRQDVAPHCEAILLDKISREGLFESVYPHIACSHASCYFCTRYFTSWNDHYCESVFTLRTDPDVIAPPVLPWVLPKDAGDDMSKHLRATFHTKLMDIFLP